MLVFLYAIITSWRGGKPAAANPWGGKTLEWQTETPVPLENFPVLPVVTSDPYGRDDTKDGARDDARVAKDAARLAMLLGLRDVVGLVDHRGVGHTVLFPPISRTQESNSA